MRIDHLAITVSDLQRAKDFFVRYFGCTLSTDYRNPHTGLHSCFVSFDGEAQRKQIPYIWGLCRWLKISNFAAEL